MFEDTRGDVQPKKTNGLVPVAECLPPNLMLLPVSQTTLFPGMIVPFILPEGKLTTTVEYASAGTGYLGVILSRIPAEGAIAAGPATSMTGSPVEGSVAAGNVRAGVEGDFFRYRVAAKILKK